MLTIRTTTGSYFDLIPGTKLSIEENSPLFSDAGSFSLPLELPPTDNNSRILEYPHRPDRRKKFITSLDVIIECGVWIRHARMDVETAGKNKSITTSLFFRESPFYEKMKDVKLPDLFRSIRQNYFADKTSPIYEWRLYLNKVMCGDTNENYYLFPVCAKAENFEKSTTTGVITENVKWSRYTIFNRPFLEMQGSSEHLLQTSQSGKKYYSLHPFESAYTEDDVEYKLPYGYGWSPFLKFTYVIRTIFDRLGYDLTPSIFESDASFKKLCILHNTADALVRGYIDFWQLLPDILVSDFIKSVENSFGCRFIVNEASKRITPRFWKDVLSESPSKDISSSFHDYPLTAFTESRSIKLTVNRVLPESTPMRFETYAQIFQKYGTYRGSYKSGRKLQEAMNFNTLQNGVYLLHYSRNYAALQTENDVQEIVFDIEKDTLDYFDNNLKTEFDEHACGFNVVALKDVALRGLTAKRRHYTVHKKVLLFENFEQWINDYYSKFFMSDDGIIGRIPYIDSIRHLNTVMETTTKKDDVSTIERNEEKEVSLPLLFCMHHGFAAQEGGRPEIERTFFASPDAYDNMGEKLGTFDLSARSLYDTFWKEYDTLLKTSLHVISGRADLNLSDVMNLRFDAPFLLDGQKVLAESIQYELSDDGIEVVDFKVKTIKTFD